MSLADKAMQGSNFTEGIIPYHEIKARSMEVHVLNIGYYQGKGSEWTKAMQIIVRWYESHILINVS